MEFYIETWNLIPLSVWLSYSLIEIGTPIQYNSNIKDTPLVRITEVKGLSVYFDARLSFRNHILLRYKWNIKMIKKSSVSLFVDKSMFKE